MTTTTTIATTDNQRWQQRQRPTTMTTNGSGGGTGSSTVSQVVSCVYSLPVAVNCTPRPFFSFLLLSLVSDMALSIFVRSLFLRLLFPTTSRVAPVKSSLLFSACRLSCRSLALTLPPSGLFFLLLSLVSDTVLSIFVRSLFSPLLLFRLQRLFHRLSSRLLCLLTARPGGFFFLLLSLVSDMALSIFVRSLFLVSSFQHVTRLLLTSTSSAGCGVRAPAPAARGAGTSSSSSGAGRGHWQQQRAWVPRRGRAGSGGGGGAGGRAAVAVLTLLFLYFCSIQSLNPTSLTTLESAAAAKA